MILAFRSCLAIRQTLSPDVGAIRSGMKFMFVAEGGDRDVSKINQTEVSAEVAVVFWKFYLLRFDLKSRIASHARLTTLS